LIAGDWCLAELPPKFATIHSSCDTWPHDPLRATRTVHLYTDAESLLNRLECPCYEGIVLTNKLRLKVNEAKSAVARPEERKFLGFSISNDGSERRIAPKALEKFKGRCHANLKFATRSPEVPVRAHAAVAVRHVRNASSLRTRSVLRDVRWRWTLNVLWTAA